MIFFCPPIRLVTVTNKRMHNQALEGAPQVVQDGIAKHSEEVGFHIFDYCSYMLNEDVLRQQGAHQVMSA